MRYVRTTVMAQLAVSSMMISAVFGQAPPTLSVGNYQLIGEQRATRAEWYATYRAELVNTGPARGPVTARLRSVAPAIQTIAGQDLLHFPAVPANGRVVSIDTFTVKIDRSVATNFATDLVWSFDNPVANAGQNQTVRVGSTVLLSGSNSSNPAAAGVLTYEWEFASRPANSQAVLNNATSVNPSFTVDVPGTYIVTLTVRNGSGMDRSQVAISTVNSPPVANAGPNQTVAVGSTVTLNGGGSYDVDGDSLMFNWSFITRPSGSLAVLSNNRVIGPTFVVDKPGTYIVQLIVNDGTADSTPATVTISTTNSPPVANAGQNQTVAVGAVVQLNGAGSTDIDGDALTYKWSFISVPSGSTATLSGATAVNPTFTVDRAGTYVVQLIVNDGKIDSAPATVTISTATIQPPTAVCGPNQTVLHGTTVTLSATCTDPQGLPLTYLWSLITRPAGSLATLSSTTAVSPTFVADKPGIFVAQLIVSNGTVNSQPCTTTITTTNAAPVANAGPGQTVSVGATVTLDGGGSYDPDQDPLTYSWSLLSRPSQSLAMLSGANSKNPTFIADEPGTYVAQLIVNDGFVSSAPATVTITAVAMKITLSPNPLNLIVTLPGTLNVALGTAAENGGVIVSLTFDPTVVSMPSSVTIPSGATSVNVPVTPVAVGASNVLATSPGYLAGTASINVAAPSISLTLPSGIGLTRTVNGTVTLSAPAPAGGVNVTLTSNPAGIVTFSPTTVPILAGNSTGTFTATGAAEGNATVTAAAPGYTSGTASVLVATLGGISVPPNVTVAPGASAPLNISLTSPAPSGGTTVNLVSSDTSIATVTPSVFVPQGSTTPATAPQVTGVNFGSATISASSPGYVGDSQTVTVTITLTLSPQAVTVGVGGAKSINLLLSAPAPTGGLTINLNSSNPGVATVPTSVIVPQGTTTAQFTVTSVAAGTATITAQAASPVVQPATATVNSVILGAIGVPANTTVGLGQSVPFPITLSAAPAEAVTVNLSSSNTNRVTISPATVTIAAGQTQPAQQPQVTGVGLGTATITASANGYGTASGSVQTTASLSFSPSTLTIAGTETKTTNVVLSAPAPAGGLAITLTATPAGIVTVPASVTIAAGATQAPVSVQGVSGGTVTITASAADVTSGTATVTVQSAGAIGLPSGVTLAPGQSAPFPVTLPTAAPADTTVTLTSSDPGKVTIAPTSVVVLSGQTQPATQPQVTGVNFGTASITASAPGYTSSSQQVTVAGSLSFSPQTLTISGTETKTLTLTLSAPAPAGGMVFNISSSATGVATVPSTVTMPAGQNSVTVPVTGVAPGTAVVRAQAPNLADATANVTVTAPADIIVPATLNISPGDSTGLPISLSRAESTNVFLEVTSNDPSKVTVTEPLVMIPAGQTQPSSNRVSITGVGVGSAILTVRATNITLTPATTTVVVAYGVTVTPSNLTIAGPGLNGLLGLTLSVPAPAGGITFTATSTNPSVATAPPSIVMNAGWSSLSFPVTAVAPGTTVIRLTSPLTQEVTATVTVEPPGTINLSGPATIVLSETGTLTVTLSKPAPAGGTTVNLASSDTHKVTVTPASVSIPAGATQPAAQPQLTAVNVGAATITASATAYTAATPLTVNVNATITWMTPELTIVGVGAKGDLYLRLNAMPSMDGVFVNLSSSNPSVATIQSTAVFIWDGSTTNAIVIPVTATGIGTATIRASGVNIPEVTATVTVVGQMTITTATLPDGVVGNAYSAALAVAGGTAPYTWQATGLPANLAINPSTGQITGTPTAAGTSTVTVTVTDSASPTAHSASKTFSLTVNSTSSLSITTSSLPNGTAGVAYSATVAATGGAAPLTWSATGLPASLTIHPSTGQITGTPTAAGTSTVTVTVTDSSSPAPQSASKTFSLTINAAALTITTTSLPNGTVGAAYNATVAATGGTNPYTWSATGLPANLTINPNTGQITGTPTAAGTSTVTVTVTDASSPTPQTASKTLSLTIGAPAELTITTASLPNGTTGTPYSATMAATGGLPPYLWSASRMPLGLSINSSTGQITGTPTEAGTYAASFTVTDANSQTASRNIMITVTAPPLTITTTSLPGGTATLPYSATVNASGGVSPYQWSASGLPAGLSMNPSTGQITGTVGAPGVSTVTVTVQDASNPAPLTASKTFTLTIASLSPVIDTETLPAGAVGSAYSANVAASGGTPPYAWSATGLPAGLNINPGTGQITGTPTAAGTSSVTITVTDSAVPPRSGSKTFSLTIAAAPLVISTATLPNGTVGAAYNATVAATGGTPGYTWSATGLPAGLNLNPGTGQITGTPTAAGTSTVNVTVTDSGVPTPQTASKTFTVTIAPTLLSITTSSLPAGMAGASYSTAVTATGGVTPYQWSATGLPGNLAMNANTGEISGTPIVAGSFPVTITVTDAATPTPQTATKTLNLVVNPTGLAITTTSLPDGMVGAGYSSAAIATGGIQPYTWSATGLPANLTINASTGQITGTPAAAGVSSVTITVQDSSMPAPQTATKTFSLTIVPPPLVITTAMLPNGVVNTPYSAMVEATGGTAPYTWSAADLPAGLGINPTTGQITGTPTAVGRVTATITVTDSSSPQLTTSKGLSINIVTVLTITTTSLPTGVVGAAYNASVAAGGGVGPYSFSATGLPAELSINPATGQITGTPSAAGSTSVTITATDSGTPNPQTANKTFSLVIAAPLNITTTSLPSGVRGAPYTATVTATGGVPPFSWTATGLPAGLNMDPSTGQISGTPTVVSTSPVLVTVADSSTTPQSVSKTLWITIAAPPLAMLTGSLPNGTAGVYYMQTFEAAGGTPPYKWEWKPTDEVNGILPDGLTLETNTGLLAGVPTTPGVYQVTVTVSDLASPPQSVSRDFTLLIGTPSGPTTLTVTNATVGSDLQAPVTIGFSPPPSGEVTLTITSGNPALVLLGTPGATGTASVTTNISAGTTSVVIYAKALAGSGTVTITASAPGYTNGTGVVTLSPSGFVLAGPNGIGAPFATFQGVTTNLTVYAGRLSGGLFAEPQQVRGGLSVNVPVSSTLTSVGTVSSPTVVFSGGMDSGNVQFIASGVNTGSTDIVVTAPSGFTTPATGATVTATVQPSGILGFSATIGKNLQAAVSTSLTAPPSSSVSLLIESLDPAKLKFATTPTAAGSTSITVIQPAGQVSSPVFYAQALDSSGTARYRVSASGYGSIESTVTLAPSGVVIKSPFGIGANFSMTVGVGNASLEIYTARLDGSGNYVESQAVAGGMSVSATVTSSNPSVGVITVSPVTISAGSNMAATEFQPLANGSSTLTASATGYTPAVQGTITATVSSTSFLLTGDVTIGKFLQYQGAVILPGRTPSSPAINVTLQSNSASLKLAKQETDAGSSSITLTIPAGASTATYYIQAFDSAGSATYTGTAAGYAPANATIYFGPSGVVVFATTPVSIAGGPKPVTVLAALLDSTTKEPLESMPLAGGLAPVVAGLTSSNPAVGTVPSTASIAPASDSGTVNFTPLATGSTVISVTQPAGWTTPSAFISQTVQVNP